MLSVSDTWLSSTNLEHELLFRPGGTKLNAIVEVHLDRILKAVLIFKGMMIEWVVVKGWEEDLFKSDNQPDIWGESRYLSDLAVHPC